MGEETVRVEGASSGPVGGDGREGKVAGEEKAQEPGKDGDDAKGGSPGGVRVDVVVQVPTLGAGGSAPSIGGRR